eukprot:TRINITY_DN112330_c0_g1_i1.p1 TRINITY_DN112330_c0_g1~~TRINITY_DN112330_c0_g1_i1.p1  ORF type:complete len:220 (-),score=28.42 TRINITY_DN112330_c0_g1_i1:108-767(-)
MLSAFRINPQRAGLQLITQLLPSSQASTWLPLGSTRGVAKYVRKGIWARGPDGQYTLDDPRIFKPGMNRKYPYHKERKFSKPYMCTRYSSAAPAGAAVKLAIEYPAWDGAADYYKLRRALEVALPGAQILGDAKTAGAVGEDKVNIRILRVNDGLELFPDLYHRQLEREGEAEKPDEFSKLKTEDFSKLVESVVNSAVDNFDWRYPSKQVAESSKPGSA